jgi:predicted nucleic acid-binding protein
MIGAELYTSQMVLVEVLTTFCKNEFLKKAAIEMIGTIADEIDVVDQTPELFDAAVVLYQNFGDKKWSLTDCASKVIMDELAIWEAATTDHHFIQMKRTILMV